MVSRRVRDTVDPETGVRVSTGTPMQMSTTTTSVTRGGDAVLT
jgi:hypothetical protein